MQSIKLLGSAQATATNSRTQVGTTPLAGLESSQANRPRLQNNQGRLKVVSIQKYHKKYIDLLVDFEALQKQNQELVLNNDKLELKIKKYDEILG